MSNELITSYNSICTVCGSTETFEFFGGSPRESFNCPKCKSSLRYREQAKSIVSLYGNNRYASFSELVLDPNFKRLNIFEPGVTGPFRKYFNDFDNYHQSFYWEDLQLGKSRDGIQNQDLMNLTYEDDTFDLIITSDIFEHVRKPFLGFEEIYRVLQPGGIHVFSIPAHHPMRKKTHFRVDTSGPEDIHIDPPNYHGDGKGGKSLVYVDYGLDFINHLNDIGFNTYLEFVDVDDRYSGVNVSFYSVKNSKPTHIKN
jgi:SAM-dependent methyltransferase